MGDPAGIGTGIIVKALVHNQIYEICRILVIVHVIGLLAVAGEERLPVSQILAKPFANCPKGRCDRNLASKCLGRRHPRRGDPVGYGVWVSRRHGFITTRNASGIIARGSYRTLRDGPFEGLSQALRAWLRSGCPAGTA